MIPESNLHHIYTDSADIHSGSILSGELAHIFESVLSCVVAPAGYHKDVYVRSFLVSANVPFIWLNLHHVTSDPVKMFWNIFLNNVKKLSPAAELIFSGIPIPTDGSEMSHILELLENLYSGQQIVIVLDHYAAIESFQFSRHLRFLSELCSSSSIHFTLLSRRVPKIVNESYILFENLSVITKDILALNSRGALAISRTSGSNWSAADCSWLVEYTHGWPNLIESIINNKINTRVYRKYIMRLCHSAYESVASEQLSTNERDMLMVLNHLGDFTAQQANEIIGLKDFFEMHDILDRLTYETVFLEKNADVYSIEGAASDFLRAEAEHAKRSPNSNYFQWIQNLSNWYLAYMQVGEAIHMHYQHEEYEQMLSILDTHTLEQLNDNDRELISDFLSSADSELLKKHPVAAIQMAFLLLKSQSHFNKGKWFLQNFRELILSSNLSDKDKAALLGSIDVSLSSRSDVSLHIRSLIQMTNGPSSNTALPSTWIIPGMLVGIHLKQGQLEKELEDFCSILHNENNTNAELEDYSASGTENIVRAEYELFRGYFSKSIYYALEALPGKRDNESAFIGLCAYFIIARASLQLNQQERIPALLNNLTQFVNELQEERLSNLKDIAIGYIAACQEKWEDIPEWILDEDQSRLCSSSSFAYIIRARKLLADNKTLDFELLARKWYAEITGNENLMPRIHFHILKAISAQKLYGSDTAAQELNKAFLLASKDSIIIPFMENASAALPIYDYGLSRGIISLEPSYQKLIENNLTVLRHSSFSEVNEENRLTNRELEILKLLNQGLNNKEIASALSISEFTVRKHIQNIYTKLNVSNKINALIRAKELYDL